jgi:4-amino-4-deoxy-L-arabinose transferase-like glycosyltransferase
LKTWLFFLLLFGALLAARLCHSGILWEPETFPMAAAKQMLAGKMLYRDIWYDKPPLVPLFYLLTGAVDGWVLRAAGAVFSLLACALAYLFARDFHGRREGLWASGLLAFFLIFDLPVSVVPIGPDMLMLVPHLLAVYLAWRGNPFWSGVAAGIAFLCNAKALFVVAACAAFCFPALGLLAAGFAFPVVSAAAVLWMSGAWAGYRDQVWIWGALYAGNTFLANPIQNGLSRTANWLGFHSALVLGSFYRWPWRMIVWMGLSLIAVAMGWRFFPRYYLQALPPLVIIASYGLARNRYLRYAALVLLLIPAVRFGPRYFTLAAHPIQPWSDTEMDRDSREASRMVSQLAKPGDTLFIWGYRPEDWVYTGLPAANRFMDCQALTGVPADRHLMQSQPVSTAGTEEARREVARSQPSFILDGLTPFNRELDMSNYPELRPWIAGYRLAARTKFTVIYIRKTP